MYVDNCPQLCALFCVCVSFLSLLLLVSLCLVNVIFLLSKHVFFFFFLQTMVERIHIFICIYSLSYEKAVFVIPGFVLFLFYTLSIRIPWCCTHYFMICIFLRFVLNAFTIVSTIGHVFVAAPIFQSSGIHKDCYFTGFWKVLSISEINRIGGLLHTTVS